MKKMFHLKPVQINQVDFFRIFRWIGFRFVKIMSVLNLHFSFKKISSTFFHYDILLCSYTCIGNIQLKKNEDQKPHVN